ncbi:hypothetical protein LP414_01470 [Polaromonas sp. P1(28)-13]|nr:hypothetical protein LP414_01470 [Polaromonas sp. P1(28)-13]
MFAGAELTDDGTPEQHEQFSAARGGAPIPLVCADKTPDEIVSFSQPVEESRLFGHGWVRVFVAALSRSLSGCKQRLN